MLVHIDAEAAWVEAARCGGTNKPLGRDWGGVGSVALGRSSTASFDDCSPESVTAHRWCLFALQAVPRFTNLTALSLRGCALTDAAAKSFIDQCLLSADETITDRRKIVGCVAPQLKVLLLGGNRFSSVALIVQLLRCLVGNNSHGLRYLQLRGNIGGTLDAVGYRARIIAEFTGLVAVDDSIVSDGERTCVSPSSVTHARRPGRPTGRRFQPYAACGVVADEVVERQWHRGDRFVATLRRRYLSRVSAAACVQRFLLRVLLRRRPQPLLEATAAVPEAEIHTSHAERVEDVDDEGRHARVLPSPPLEPFEHSDGAASATCFDDSPCARSAEGDAISRPVVDDDSEEGSTGRRAEAVVEDDSTGEGEPKCSLDVPESFPLAAAVSSHQEASTRTSSAHTLQRAAATGGEVIKATADSVGAMAVDGGVACAPDVVGVQKSFLDDVPQLVSTASTTAMRRATTLWGRREFRAAGRIRTLLDRIVVAQRHLRAMQLRALRSRMTEPAVVYSVVLPTAHVDSCLTSLYTNIERQCGAVVAVETLTIGRLFPSRSSSRAGRDCCVVAVNPFFLGERTARHHRTLELMSTGVTLRVTGSAAQQQHTTATTTSALSCVTLQTAEYLCRCIRRAHYYACTPPSQSEFVSPVLTLHEALQLLCVSRVQRWWRQHLSARRAQLRPDKQQSNGVAQMATKLSAPITVAAMVARWSTARWLRILAARRARFLRVLVKAHRIHGMDQSGRGARCVLTANACLQLLQMTSSILSGSLVAERKHLLQVLGPTILPPPFDAARGAFRPEVETTIRIIRGLFPSAPQPTSASSCGTTTPPSAAADGGAPHQPCLAFAIAGAVAVTFVHAAPGILFAKEDLLRQSVPPATTFAERVAAQLRSDKDALDHRTSTSSKQRAKRRLTHKSAMDDGVFDSSFGDEPVAADDVLQRGVFQSRCRLYPDGFFVVEFANAQVAFARQLALVVSTFCERDGTFLCFDDEKHAARIVAVRRIERWWKRRGRGDAVSRRKSRGEQSPLCRPSLAAPTHGPTRRTHTDGAATRATAPCLQKIATCSSQHPLNVEHALLSSGVCLVPSRPSSARAPRRMDLQCSTTLATRAEKNWDGAHLTPVAPPSGAGTPRTTSAASATRSLASPDSRNALSEKSQSDTYDNDDCVVNTIRSSRCRPASTLLPDFPPNADDHRACLSIRAVVTRPAHSGRQPSPPPHVPLMSDAVPCATMPPSLAPPNGALASSTPRVLLASARQFSASKYQSQFLVKQRLAFDAEQEDFLHKRRHVAQERRQRAAKCRGQEIRERALRPFALSRSEPTPNGRKATGVPQPPSTARD